MDYRRELADSFERWVGCLATILAVFVLCLTLGRLQPNVSALKVQAIRSSTDTVTLSTCRLRDIRISIWRPPSLPHWTQMARSVDRRLRQTQRGLVGLVGLEFSVYLARSWVLPYISIPAGSSPPPSIRGSKRHGRRAAEATRLNSADEPPTEAQETSDILATIAAVDPLAPSKTPTPRAL